MDVTSFHFSGQTGHMYLFGYVLPVTDWRVRNMRVNVDVTMTNSRSTIARLGVLHDFHCIANYVWSLDQVPEEVANAAYNPNRHCGLNFIEDIRLKIGCHAEYRVERAVLDDIQVLNAANDAVRGIIEFSGSSFPLKLFVSGTQVTAST